MWRGLYFVCREARFSVQGALFSVVWATFRVEWAVSVQGTARTAQTPDHQNGIILGLCAPVGISTIRSGSFQVQCKVRGQCAV